jgi:hypothetical protein
MKAAAPVVAGLVMILWVLVFMIPAKKMPQLSFAYESNCLYQEGLIALTVRADRTVRFARSNEEIRVADLVPHLQRSFADRDEAVLFVIPDPEVAMSAIFDFANQVGDVVHKMSVVTPSVSRVGRFSLWKQHWPCPVV